MSGKSYGCLLEEWGRLLAAVRAGEVNFPELTAYRTALEGHLKNVKAARARQLRLQEEGKQATRDLGQMALAGVDEVRRLRSRVKAELGPRNPRLRQFGIAPLPLKKSRKKPPCRPPAG